MSNSNLAKINQIIHKHIPKQPRNSSPHSQQHRGHMPTAVAPSSAPNGHEKHHCLTFKRNQSKNTVVRGEFSNYEGECGVDYSQIQCNRGKTQPTPLRLLQPIVETPSWKLSPCESNWKYVLLLLPTHDTHLDLLFAAAIVLGIFTACFGFSYSQRMLLWAIVGEIMSKSRLLHCKLHSH